MTDTGVEDGRPTIFSVKGTAAPSPEAQKAQQPKFLHIPNSKFEYNPEKDATNDLSGLIKRTNPTPVHPLHKFVQPARPLQPASFVEFKKPPVLPDPVILEASENPVLVRRQLTVRINMDNFERLDQLAKTSGKTYQDILSKALDRFLRENTD